MSELPVLDQARLDALAMGDQTIVDELVGMLIDDAGPLVAALRDSVAAHDRESAREQAHGLKGIAANVGAARLQHAAAQLEVAARDGAPWPDLEQLLAATATAVEEVRATRTG